MHIAFNGWFWDQLDTGSGQYLHRLIDGLHRLKPDLNMTLILPPHADPSAALPDYLKVMRAGGIQGKIGKVLFEQRTVPKLAAQAGADLLHVPYWGSPLSSPVPVVVSVLDVIPLAMPIYSRGIATKLYTSLVTASAKGANHIITLSEASKQDIVDYMEIAPEKISATHLAQDGRFHPRMGAEHDEKIREKYDLPERFVLYLGGFDRRKQVNELMLAYTYVVQSEGYEVPLVLAGREPQWGRNPVFPDLRAYAQKLDLEDVIRWIGFVDEADKAALYRLANIFVYPSMYEGFGLPVLEAMASGTPTIAAEIPVMTEIVGDGAYLVTSARSMAGAIIGLLTQEPLYDTMVNQGLAQSTRYSWRKTAQETLTVYESVLKST